MPEPASDSLSTYGHIPSTHSRDEGFDTFVFWPSDPAILVGGLNSKLHNAPVSVEKVKRWIRLISPDFGQKGVDFDIFPAALEQITTGSILAYPTQGNTTRLALTDDLEVNKSYCCAMVGTVTDAGEYTGPIWRPWNPWQKRQHSFESLKVTEEADPESGVKLEFYNIPEELQNDVLERDGDNCFLTGESPASIHWIFPPTWVPKLHDIKRLWDSFCLPGNAAMMSKTVATSMHDNAFGIDVDDGFRFVTFDPLQGNLREMLGLPECLEFLGQRDPSLVTFLREHFRWCLMVHFFGENIEAEFSRGHTDALKEAMRSHDDEALKELKQRDLWQTPAGKEIWNRMSAKYVGSKHVNL
ncbi:hypothetical protein OF83DRAFT_1288390 [Amylostereum chailletii]|nr:hypothetical protein OF83DRAFT_1288390 [Amylostereum chailletii]